MLNKGISLAIVAALVATSSSAMANRSSTKGRDKDVKSREGVRTLGDRKAVTDVLKNGGTQTNKNIQMFKKGSEAALATEQIRSGTQNNKAAAKNADVLKGFKQVEQVRQENVTTAAGRTGELPSDVKARVDSVLLADQGKVFDRNKPADVATIEAIASKGQEGIAFLNEVLAKTKSLAQNNNAQYKKAMRTLTAILSTVGPQQFGETFTADYVANNLLTYKGNAIHNWTNILAKALQYFRQGNTPNGANVGTFAKAVSEATVDYIAERMGISREEALKIAKELEKKNCVVAKG
jgi:hypothetical protein